jgi:hypothetical protein
MVVSLAQQIWHMCHIITPFHVYSHIIRYHNPLKTVASFSPPTSTTSSPPTVSLLVSPARAHLKMTMLNDYFALQTLIFQANMPHEFCVESLHTTNHLLNIRQLRAIHNITPYYLLYGAHPSYAHPRTFGCLCFPNTSSTASHKLSPWSRCCIFLGYPRERKACQCLDLTTQKFQISYHVIFDESYFPYAPRTHDATPPPSHARSWGSWFNLPWDSFPTIGANPSNTTYLNPS